jgi:CRISPR-associated protein Cas2
MSNDKYILCYDISNEKRLAKIGRMAEKEALRIQRSVYYIENMSKHQLYEFLAPIIALIDKKQDDLRLYKIKGSVIALQKGMDLENPYAIF